MNNKTITVRGGYGLGNFGDDALQNTLHEFLINRISNEKLLYSCTVAPYLGKFIQEGHIVPLNTDYTEVTDILIYGGGTQFYSFKRKNIFFRITKNAILLIYPLRLYRKIQNLILNKRSIKDNSKNEKKKIDIYALGIGVGPFLKNADKSIENNTKKLFERMNYIAVRDEFSFSKCNEWKVNSKLYSDICYKMNNPNFTGVNRSTGINNIGIIVRDWKHTRQENTYTKEIIVFYNMMKLKNIGVKFFIFSQRSDKRWIKILNERSIPYIEWNPEIMVLNDYLKRMSEMDIFITARYHGAVFSTLLSKPFISINIEPKLFLIHNLFKNGSECWSFPYSNEELCEIISKIDSSYICYVSHIVEVCKKQICLADQMFDDLDKLLTCCNL